MTLSPNPPSWLQNNSPLLVAALTTVSQADAVTEVLEWLQKIQPDFISTRNWLKCQTVVIEGFDNVIQHAHKHLPAETPIKLNLEIYAEGVEIKIYDLGEPFNFQLALTQTPDQQDEWAEHGRGLILMRRILDYISYERSPEGVNCLQMIQSFSPL